MDLITTLFNCIPPVVSVGAMVIIGRIILKIIDKKLNTFNETKDRLSSLCKLIKNDEKAKEDLKKQIESLEAQMKGFRPDNEIRKN